MTTKTSRKQTTKPKANSTVENKATEVEATSATNKQPVLVDDKQKPNVIKTEEKKPTKADLARAIYNEMVDQAGTTPIDIKDRFRKDAGLTRAGAQSYFSKFQKESGRSIAKGPTKMDKARELYVAMSTDNKTRKDIIAAFISQVLLTPAGASTYFQKLKSETTPSTE